MNYTTAIADELPPIFNTHHLARWSGIPAERWKALRRSRAGPVYNIVGARSVFYTRDALAAWLDETSRTRTASLLKTTGAE
jgi:hypothetical protein